MSRRNVYMKYSDDAMSMAVQAVLKRNMSVRKASNLYSVPFSTLYGRVQAARAQAVGGLPAIVCKSSKTDKKPTKISIKQYLP